MNTTTDIKTLLNWSLAREVQTRQGPRLLQTAVPTPDFWTMWRADQSFLRAAGVSVSKDNRTGEWQVCWWQPLAVDVVTARAQAVEASKATDAVVEIPVPEGLTYLPYQKAGISYALAHPSCLIADEMGLGKTIQAIGIINSDASIKRVLVVCPASLKLNWRKELQKWLVRPLAITIANGKFPAECEVVIVNYDILKKYSKEIRATEWDLLVIDEAHLTKNPKAIRSQQVWGAKETKAPYAWKMLPIPARRRLALTGTPIVNRPIEAWPILNGLAPEEFNSFWSYAKRYCAASQGRYGWDMSGADHLPELQEKLRRSVMVRRLKADVLIELPPKRRQVVEIPAEGEAARAVADETANWQRFEDGLQELRMAVELSKAGDENEYDAAVAKLRDASSVAFTEMSKQRHVTAVAKIPAVIAYLEEMLDSTGKVVLFAHHHDVIDALAAHFGGACVTLTGQTPLEQRQAAVERFQNDSTCSLFIGNILAAGVGLTLTASSHVVFAELDWVPGNISQAEDRCHRIGQKDSVSVVHLVLEGSLDVQMAKTLIEKQEIIDQALDREAPVVVVPTKERAVTESASRAKIAKEAETMSSGRIAAVHECLKILAGVCDGAFALDGWGFNKMDSSIGKSLAAQPFLSPRQAALGLRFATKYRRQLPPTLVAACQSIGETSDNVTAPVP